MECLTNILYLFIFFILLNHFFTLINTKDLTFTSLKAKTALNQKCFKYDTNINPPESKLVYEILNDPPTNSTIFIQFDKIKFVQIFENKIGGKIINEISAADGDIGSTYLTMNDTIKKYYIKIGVDNYDKYELCLDFFPNKGKEFYENPLNPKIKIAKYSLLNIQKFKGADLAFFINVTKKEENKKFYAVRLSKNIYNIFDDIRIYIKINSQKYINTTNVTNILNTTNITNTKNTTNTTNITNTTNTTNTTNITNVTDIANFENITNIINITRVAYYSYNTTELYYNSFYKEKNYYYIPFFIEKNYSDKFKNVTIVLNLIKNNSLPLISKKKFNFKLELIETREINGKFDLIINNKIDSPIIYYINLNRQVKKYGRDILMMTNSIESKFLKMRFSNYYNITKKNTFLINKDIFAINNNTIFSREYGNGTFINLLFFIVDNKNIQNKSYFVNFLFFSGFTNTINYHETLSAEKLFDNNKLTINENICRPKLYLNYIKKNKDLNEKNREGILDYVSINGEIKVFNNHIYNKFSNVSKYMNFLLHSPIDNVTNSFLNNECDIFMYTCDYNYGFGSILVFEKNNENSVINFTENNQRTLLLIEPNKLYEFKFNENDTNSQFNFRIRIYKKSNNNNNTNTSLYINYDNKISKLENEKYIILKHLKSNDAHLEVKLLSGNNSVIIEIIKQINIEEKNIEIVKSETIETKFNSKEKNSLLLFYEKSEINSLSSKIIITSNSNVSVLCISKGYGTYPFIMQPLCQKENEFISLQKNKKFILQNPNPYKTNISINEDLPLYIYIIPDGEISYSYSFEYEKKIEIDEYYNINSGKNFIELKGINEKNNTLYYQINICKDNNVKDNSFYFFYGKGEPKELKNKEIYEEIFDQDNFTFINNGKYLGRFKYNYGKKDLIIWNRNFDNKIQAIIKQKETLILSVDSPFLDVIELLIIFQFDIESEIKYTDFCSFMDFYKNNNKFKNDYFSCKKTLTVHNDTYSKKIEMSINKEDLENFDKKDVNIYIVARQLETEMEYFYEMRSMFLDFDDILESNYTNNTVSKIKNTKMELIDGVKNDIKKNIEHSKNYWIYVMVGMIVSTVILVGYWIQKDSYKNVNTFDWEDY